MFSLLGRGEAKQDVLSSREGWQNRMFSLPGRGLEGTEQGILSSREG